MKHGIKNTNAREAALQKEYTINEIKEVEAIWITL